MAAIRDVFSTAGPRSRDDAIREVAAALGYQRVGSRISDLLDGYLRTAVRRGILENAPEGLGILCRSITDYEHDFLLQQLVAGMGGKWWTRDDLIYGTARWLGFRRTGPVIRDTLRAAITSAVRQGLLEREGPEHVHKVR